MRARPPIHTRGGLNTLSIVPAEGCRRYRPVTLYPSCMRVQDTKGKRTTYGLVCSTYDRLFLYVFSLPLIHSDTKPVLSESKPFRKMAMYIRPSTRAFSRRYIKPLLVVKPTHLHPNRLHFSNKNVTISLAIGQDFAKISSLTSPRCTHNDEDGHTHHGNSSPKSANSQPNR